MRLLCLIAALSFALFIPAHAGHSPPKVTLGVHVQTTGEGQSNLEASALRLPPNGDQILIRTMPECSERDIIDAQQDEQGLRIQFNHVGQVNLSAVTAQNQGRLLIVLIYGRVIYAPVIDTQITSGELDIPLKVKPEVLKALQDQAAYNVRQAKKT